MTGLIATVARHADSALTRAADRWGAPSPLLADGIDPDSGEPTRWQECVVSDLACQQNLLRTLEGLAALDGAPRWRAAADDWIGHALRVLRDADSDLLYWGGHSAWDLGADAPMKGNHELKCAYPHYAGLHAVDGEATQAFVEAFWQAHIWDGASLLFNRHGEYEAWDRARTWNFGSFEPDWPLPIVENTALSFINTGSDLIWAACELHRLTGQAAPLTWATNLLSRYDAIRHPETGLGGYQFNHRDPCRVRASFKGELGERADVNETTVISQGYIGTRYGRAACVFLQIAEALDETAGAPFRALVRRDADALWAHSWDAGAGVFHPVLNDGTRLSPADVEDVGYCPPSKLGDVGADGLMLLACARAYRVLGDEVFRERAGALMAAMGWGAADGGPPSPEAVVAEGGNDACALEALLEIASATGEAGWLDAARSLADRLVARHDTDGLLAAPARGTAGIDSNLPVALLHLEALTAGREGEVPAFVPNLSPFDPKILARDRGLR